MTVDLVLTAISKDRPQLVETLAAVIAEHSGNWIDSSMARLGGEFAGILRVSVPDDRASALEDALVDLESEGITVTIRKDTVGHGPRGRHASLELTGLDHKGIILEVTKVLARHHVSVDELHTSVFTSSMSGDPMFSATADIILPDELSTDLLRDALEEIAHDLMVDLELKELT